MRSGGVGSGIDPRLMYALYILPRVLCRDSTAMRQPMHMQHRASSRDTPPRKETGQTNVLLLIDLINLKIEIASCNWIEKILSTLYAQLSKSMSEGEKVNFAHVLSRDICLFVCNQPIFLYWLTLIRRPFV